MNQDLSYKSDEINHLNEKLQLYKEVMTSLKSGNIVEDYLLTKYEINEFKLNSEGVMKKMEEYHYGVEQKTKELSAQVQSVNETVSMLKRDIDFIKEKMERLQVHDLFEKMNKIIDTQSQPVKQIDSEVDRLKDEITQLKQQISYQQQSGPSEEVLEEKEESYSRRTSEYRKLQDMLKSPHLTRKSDYHTPASYNHLNNQYRSHSQNKQNYSRPPLTQEQVNWDSQKKRAYINQQLDLNRNTIIRGNTKKNTDESAQELTNKDEHQEKNVVKKTFDESSLKSSSAKEVMRPQTNMHEGQQRNPALEKQTHKDAEEAIRKDKHQKHLESNEEQSKEADEPPKKMELSNLFSIFQKRS